MGSAPFPLTDPQDPVADSRTLVRLHLKDFKRFPEATIELSPEPRLFVGRNGSGKTQLLWAIQLFFLAYNGRSTKSTQSENQPFSFSNLGGLLGTPYFVQGNEDFGSFVRRGATSKLTEIGATLSDGTTITYRIKANGQMTLDSSHDPQDYPKIRFALVTASVQFAGLATISALEELVSSGPRLRPIFKALSQGYKDLVNERLREFFPTHATIRSDDYKILVTDNAKCETDIGLCGSAFQKVFAAFTMLFTLASVEERQRVLLVEEPESQLYPSLVADVFDRLAEDARAHGIHLIATTGAKDIMLRVPPDNIVVLSPELTTAVPLANVPHELVTICPDLVTPRPLLFVEGDDDIKFYKKYCPSAARYQLVTGSNASPEQHQRIIAVACGLSSTRCRFLFLRDCDRLPLTAHRPFCDDLARTARASDTTSATVAYHLLAVPTIEAFFVLYDLSCMSVDQRTAVLVQYVALPNSERAFTNSYEVAKGNLEKQLCGNTSMTGDPSELWRAFVANVKSGAAAASDDMLLCSMTYIDSKSWIRTPAITGDNKKGSTALRIRNTPLADLRRSALCSRHLDDLDMVLKIFWGGTL